MATDVNGRESAEQTPERPGAPTDPQTPSGGSPETHHEAALAKARAAAFRQLQQDTGETHPRWRLIATDSESLTGLAPACNAENSDALHEIPDYPGGPARDEHGVYDCCPWPQIETYSTVIAAYLVGLLNADVEQLRATADFFQPGHTYAREHHASTIRFLVRYIDDSPEGIPYRVAFGWRTEDGDVCASPFDSDDFEGWTDVTAVCPVGGENAQETGEEQ